MTDAELSTRKREPGLQLRAQQNAAGERELGAGSWKEEVELGHC